MVRKQRRPAATRQQELVPLRDTCESCGGTLWRAYHSVRTITTLDGLCQLLLTIRRCHSVACQRYHYPYRPEEEGHWALPHGEFGLDIITLIGTLRYKMHRSVPEMHQELCKRGVVIAERTVTNLLARYEELVTLHLTDQTRLRERLTTQGHVILALDGLQPDVGHAVLWVLHTGCQKGGLPRELERMHSFLTKGLTETHPLWEDVQTGYTWVHRAAHLLTNDEKQNATQVRQSYETLLTEMKQMVPSSHMVTTMLTTFCKVTASYWPGLFHCYDEPDLPRTNNDLEQYFGSARRHERRATGRKTASPGLVVRGSVRILALVALPLHHFTSVELRLTDVSRWQALRSELDDRQEARRKQHRFRKSPKSYLLALEAKLIKERLPS